MNILIVGLGSIGLRHRRVLRALYPSARIEVVSRHSLIEDDVIAPSMADVKELGSYDYFVVSGETHSHWEQLAYLDSSVVGKKIFVEKPLLVAEGDSEIGRRNAIHVGYNLRYHPVITSLRTFLESRTVLSARVEAGQYLPRWRPGRDYRGSYSSSSERGGGVLLDLSHELDYSAWLFGELGALRAINRKVSGLEIDSDDLLELVGLTARGSVLSLGVDYLSRIPYRRLRVQCEDSTVFADLIASRIDYAVEDEPPRSVVLDAGDRDATYASMHADILDSGGALACTVREARALTRTIESIRQSERRDWRHG